MFDKLRQLKQIKDIQDALKKEVVEIEKEGIKVQMNGKMEVEQITLNPALEKGEQEKILKECFNEAIKKIQMAAFQKISQVKDLSF